MGFNLTYKPYGADSILIEWPSVINENVLFDVLSFREKILKAEIILITDVNSAYNSILVTCNLLSIGYKEIVAALNDLYLKEAISTKRTSRQWKIPVCYDAFFAVDLDEISLTKNISKEVIIERHSQINYTVYFIGFLPGFLYLGGLDASLYVPRKETPRLKIERGAVAIGGKQTGVYPTESPGGWNIIGNTPISFFHASKSKPCFAKPGDSIKFHSITIKEYNNIKVLVDVGVYQMESEVFND